MLRARLANRSLGSWVVVFAVAFAAAKVDAQIYPKLSRSDLRTLQESFSDLADEIRPTVAAVRTYDGFRPYSQGSGVIFRSNGYILTNYHVLEEAPRVIVILHDGREYDAVVMQIDKRSDLAVIKIEAEGLKAAKLGDLTKVRVGHWAFAMGNPFGLSNRSGKTSFTVGNVSSIGRVLTGQLDDGSDSRYYGNLIETSAAINPGNSGGPLFNIDGEVIGIVCAIETRSGANEGVGFAIPISRRTRKIIDKLVAGEEFRYGYLGVEIGDSPVERLHSFSGRKVRGAAVANVISGGPAHAAGLRSDDVIVALDGEAVENSDHLIRLIGSVPPGEDIEIEYIRNGRRHATTAALDDRVHALNHPVSHDTPHIPMMNWRGALFAEMTAELKHEHGVSEAEVGIMVVDVRPSSDAAKRGLTDGSIVRTVNGERVKTLQQFRDAYSVAAETVRLQLDNKKVIRFPRG